MYFASEIELYEIINCLITVETNFGTKNFTDPQISYGQSCAPVEITSTVNVIELP